MGDSRLMIWRMEKPGGRSLLASPGFPLPIGSGWAETRRRGLPRCPVIVREGLRVARAMFIILGDLFDLAGDLCVERVTRDLPITFCPFPQLKRRLHGHLLHLTPHHPWAVYLAGGNVFSMASGVAFLWPRGLILARASRGHAHVIRRRSHGRAKKHC